MFARLANGNAGPVRVIEGQGSKLSRTMHGIAYDAVHDEIIVPVHLAGAVLVFRAGASGEEAPIRIIQGPHTRILRPETVELDLKNNEIVIGEDGGKDVMFFPREANGDVAPLRTIRGPKTGLDEVRGVAVDPVRNLLVVSSRSSTGTTGVFIFNRTDDGNVSPRAIIGGPKSGILRIRQVQVDPEQGKVFSILPGSGYHRVGSRRVCRTTAEHCGGHHTSTEKRPRLHPALERNWPASGRRAGHLSGPCPSVKYLWEHSEEFPTTAVRDTL